MLVKISEIQINEEYETLVPPLSYEDLKNLKNSIKEDGLLYPVLVNQDNVLLDGHHRVTICKDLGISDLDAKVKPFTDLYAEKEFCISTNLNRRHMTNAQKAELGLKLLELEEEKAKERQENSRKDTHDKKGQFISQPVVLISEPLVEEGENGLNQVFSAKPIVSGPVLGKTERQEKNGKSLEIAAKKVGVGKDSLYKAKKIKEAAQSDPQIKKRWEDAKAGKTTINRAYQDVKQKEIKENAKPPAPLPDGEFNVLLADPPWKYDFSETGSRKVETQYPTMTLEDIKKLNPPSSINSVLFLWATAPKLKEALMVMESWGFVYKSQLVWDKMMIGMGYWFRGQHELLLVGIKGKVSPPKPENRTSSVLKEKRKGHSQKPERIYRIIEQMVPGGKYLELFARNGRKGWTSWGNEV